MNSQSTDRSESGGTESAPLQKSREVRLGLVLYGGVSLAIYINGVASQFFDAVMGRGIFRLIKALTDSDIVVDIISGTSAGGINGVLLAYALCNQKDFSDTAALWRQAGGIEDLLRDPRDSADSTSVLNSRGYYQPELEKAFRHMRDFVPSELDEPTRFSELDLFVTGTSVYGSVYTTIDDAGHSIDVKDHRAVFLLQHREGRKEQFSPPPEKLPVLHRALARLCCITSCFPGAFEPVHVSFDGPEDQYLREWGQIEEEAYFLDGGVLDNKPFSHTIRQIYYRTADRPVSRRLFYVEPDPESFQASWTKQELKSPDFVQSILTSVLGIPRYESIADDLKAISVHNSKVEQVNRLVKNLQEGTSRVSLTAESRKLYENSRLISLSERVVEGLLKAQGRRQPLLGWKRKAASDLVRAFDEQIRRVDELVIFRDFDVYYRIRRLFRTVYLLYDCLYAEGAVSDSPERERGLLMVFNRQIRLWEVIRTAMEKLVDDAPADWRGMDEGFQGIWAEVQAMYYRLLDPEGASSQILPRRFDPSLHASGAEVAWLPRGLLSELNAALRRMSKKIIEDRTKGTFALVEQGESVLPRLDQVEQEILAHFIPDPGHPVRRAYEQFESLDALLFPLELSGNLHEKDLIQTVRISPVDAQKGFSKCPSGDKVAGDAFHHFGGFFKKSWRSNDILWGKLDGLCQLVETLLERESLHVLLQDPNRRTAIRAHFRDESSPTRWKRAVDPAHLFPSAGEATHLECRRWLEDLLSDDDGRRGSAFEPKRYARMLEWLIEATQLEVIKRDLPWVLIDGRTEADQWKVSPHSLGSGEGDGEAVRSRDRQGWTQRLKAFFKGGAEESYVAPVSSAYSAVEQITETMEEYGKLYDSPERPSKTGLGRFFTGGPRVGSETIAGNIPPLVLLGVLSKALLVTRNCLLNALGDRAERVKSQPLYRYGLHLPLVGFHSLVQLSRSSSRMGFGILTALLGASLLLMVLGAVFFSDLFLAGGGSVIWRGMIFFGIPLVVLSLIFCWGRYTRRLKR